MNSDPNREVEIFSEALQLAPSERSGYLDRACGGDNELRRKVEALLASQDQIGDFLEESPQKILPPAKAGVVAGEKPGDHIGHYKLLQQIGEGGYGTVFMAEQEEPVRRRVALKVIKAGMDTKSVIARFEAERQALALMDHPNIAKIFDAGATESGRPYFVMELIRGIKITEYCDQHSLSTFERLKLFVQVCQAVQHAHQKGIIHRDIKPSNILVAQTGQGEPLPVIIDFGIAKTMTNQQLTDKTLFTAFEMLIGTPAYMSPEQATLTTLDVDTRTDVYSLGVLLYELLTGSPPFDTGELLKSGLDEIRRVIREQEPVRPSTRLGKLTQADLTTVAQSRHAEPPGLIRTVHGDLDWIVMKALEKDRSRRYATANGFAMDVGRYLSGEAILARPPSAAYKLRKLVARNRLVFSSVTLIFVLLVTSLITTTRWLMIEKRTREELQQRMELAQYESRGWELFYKRKFDESEKMLFKALTLRRQFPQLERSSAPLIQFLLTIFFTEQRADKVMPFIKEYVDPALLSKDEYREFFGYAAMVVARFGRWDEANALAEQLYKADPTSPISYHLRAPLFVVKGDVEAYRRLCAEIISQFGNTTNISTADQMAKDCLILPSAGVDLKTVSALAGLALNVGSNSPTAPFFLCCKALAEYRLGQYEDAASRAQLAAKGPLPHSKAEAAAIIAMSRFNLGELDSARNALADCDKIIEERLPKLGADLGPDWRDWIIAQALRSEARQLIEGNAAADKNLPAKSK